MKKNLTNCTLDELEVHYESMLRKVRDLKADVSGTVGEKSETNGTHQDVVSRLTAVVPTVSRQTAKAIGEPALDDQFKLLTKGDAAERVLRAHGKAMRKHDIFAELQRLGHPVASLPAFTSALSADKKRFKSEGNGMWSLAQPDLTSASSKVTMEDPAFQ